MTRIAIVSAGLLAACATSYGPMSMGNGYSDTQVGENAFRVSFAANTSTSAEQASDFTLLRSAEVTLEHGFTHFVVASEESTAKVIGGGKYGHTGTAPASQATILCYKGKPADAGALVYDAAVVRKTMRTKYDIRDAKPEPARDAYGNEIEQPKKK